MFANWFMDVLSQSIYDPIGGESKSCSPSLIDKEDGLVQDGMDMEQSMV